MKDIEHVTEQSKINKLVNFIRNESQDQLSKYEEAFKNYYNVNLPFEKQREFQIFEQNSKDDIQQLKEAINSPYIGRIKTLNVNGELKETVISHKDLFLGSDRVIHSVWSSEGRAFTSRLPKYNHLNVVKNRIVEIRMSLLQSYLDVINRVEEDLGIKEKTTIEEVENNFVNKTKFSDLIEINKRRKDILTTLDHIQNKIIDLPLDKNVVIHGVPGSGKTIIGGYRLSSLSYQFRERSTDFNQVNQFHYFTSSDNLKLYSLSFFSKIDLEGINFYSIDRIYDFTTIKSTTDPTTRQVYNQRLDVKGYLVSRDEFDDRTKSSCRVKIGRKVYEFDKSDLLVYQNDYSELAVEVFGRFNRNKKITNFYSFRESDKFTRAFQILNSKKFLNDYMHNIKKKLVFSPDKLQGKLSNDFNLSHSDYTVTYLMTFIKIYYFVKNFNKFYRHRRNVRSIFIDEGQDYALCEYQMFNMIYNKAYITVCGDVNQSNGISPTNPSWNTLIELLDAQFIKFNTCYRSSEAVVKSFNSRMTNTQYGPAENYEGAVDGYVKHIRSLNSQNSVIFNDFDVEETMLLFLSDDDEKLISENAYLRRFERMSAFEVKGMEFNNVILVINGYDLTSAADQRFRYMLISRALKNFISIGLI